MRYRRVECPNCGATGYETEHGDIDCPKCGLFDPAPKKCDTTCPTCGLYWTREGNEDCPRCDTCLRERVASLESRLASVERERDEARHDAIVLEGLRSENQDFWRPYFNDDQKGTPAAPSSDTTREPHGVISFTEDKETGDFVADVQECTCPNPSFHAAAAPVAGTSTGEPSSDDLINHFGFYAREYSRISIQFRGGDQEEIALRRMDDAEKALRSRLASVEREKDEGKAEYHEAMRMYIAENRRLHSENAAMREAVSQSVQLLYAIDGEFSHYSPAVQMHAELMRTAHAKLDAIRQQEGTPTDAATPDASRIPE